MNKLCAAALFGALAMASAGTEAQTQRVRAIITGLEGNVLAVTTRDGAALKIHLADKAEVR